MTIIRSSNTPVATSCFPTPNQTTTPTVGPELQPSPQIRPGDGFDFRAYERQQFAAACRTLLTHFQEVGGASFFKNGTIDQNELYMAAQGKNGPEVQQAAQFLLQHPEYVRELETRGAANPDGKISAKDLSLELNVLNREQTLSRLRFDPRLPDFQRSLSTIAQYMPLLDQAGAGPFGGLFGPDGKISKKDLDAVITGTQYPPELRQAAFFLSMNPDLQALLDTSAQGGRPDGIISNADIQSMLGTVNGLQQQMPTPPIYRTVQG